MSVVHMGSIHFTRCDTPTYAHTYTHHTDGSIAAENGSVVTLKDLLVFFSGEETEPPLGFNSRPFLGFCDQNPLAEASTCDFGLYIPSNHHDYVTFKDYMTLSLLGHDGFGRV